MGGKGNGKKEKRARPSSSTGDELEEDGHHYGELLALYKALEQKDAEKSVEIASLKALLKAAKDDLKALITIKWSLSKLPCSSHKTNTKRSKTAWRHAKKTR